MDQVLVISLATIASALAGLMIRYSFRSKCLEINLLWGCLKIKRDIEVEAIEDLSGIQKTNSVSDISL